MGCSQKPFELMVMTWSESEWTVPQAPPSSILVEGGMTRVSPRLGKEEEEEAEGEAAAEATAARTAGKVVVTTGEEAEAVGVHWSRWRGELDGSLM